MARLIDDLRAAKKVQAPFWLDHSHGAAWDKHAARILKTIREESIPVLLIDNVADYYMTGSDQEYWDLVRDFPNLAPPYGTFWTEHRIPKKIHSREFGDNNLSEHLGPHARTGILWQAATEFQGENIPENVKWILMGEVFIDYDVYSHDIEGPSGSWMFAIDEHGVLVDRPFLQAYIEPRFHEIMPTFVSLMHPALLAVSFLHCKNVKMVPAETPKPLAKKFHARTGIWPTPFHTLEIEPLKQMLRHEGRSGEVGLAKAMHICRGHFKDYRQGAGLFGKYHQLVWQPSVVRGTQRGPEKMTERQIEIKLT